MKKLTSATLATLFLFLSTVTHAQESAPATTQSGPPPAAQMPTAPPPDIILTQNLTVDGQAILAPGTVIGGNMNAGGCKYGEIQLPGSYTLNRGTVLDSPLYLKSGAVIPSGTKINGNSKFEKPDQLPASAYTIGANLIAGDAYATPADLTVEALRQRRFNDQTQTSFMQAASLFERQATQIAGNTGEIQKLRVQVEANTTQIAELKTRFESFSTRLAALEAKPAAATPPAQAPTTPAPTATTPAVTTTTPAVTTTTTPTATTTAKGTTLTSVTMGGNPPAPVVYDQVPRCNNPQGCTVQYGNVCSSPQGCNVQYTQPTCTNPQGCNAQYGRRRFGS